MTDLQDVSVSICIASYNMADTIEESLASIVEHLPGNFEVVVVNQSTDGSRKIVERVAAESDVAFRTVHTSFPLGVGHARNLAVCEATGDIVITHVDADDWYDSRYFPALAELYLAVREARGSDYFFSSPNMNISSREHMREAYLLTSLPVGVNENEYRWRALSNGEFVQLNLDEDVSGRIKLSDRKTLASRARRTYLRQLGMYKIGYSTERILREDVIEPSWSLPSRLFRMGIIPLVWTHSLFVQPVCDAPSERKTLPQLMAERTYNLNGLKEEYAITNDLIIDELSSEREREMTSPRC